MKKLKTTKATDANVKATISYAIEVFTSLENYKDVLGENPSNGEIARTLNQFNIKTRLGNKWYKTSIKRLKMYEVDYLNHKAKLDCDSFDLSALFG